MSLYMNVVFLMYTYYQMYFYHGKWTCIAWFYKKNNTYNIGGEHNI